MAQGDITLYNTFKKAIGDGSVDFDTDTIKCALVNAYTPNIDTHQFWSDVSANEISATNYTAGGVSIATQVITVDTTNDQAEYDAADAAWTALGTATVTHGIIYKDTGTPTTSQLIGYVELTTNPNGGNYTIAWGAEGIFKLV